MTTSIPAINLELDGKRVEALHCQFEKHLIHWIFPANVHVLATVKQAGKIYEYQYQLHNPHASERSGLITQFEPLSLSLPCSGVKAPVLHGSRGSLNEALFPPESWRQWSTSPVSEGNGKKRMTIGSIGGRASHQYLPFAILEEMHRTQGYVLGIGWAGDWHLSFMRNQEICTVNAGMNFLNLKLEPGETLRQPTILIGTYQGNVVEGQRQLRVYLRDSVQPQLAGEPVEPLASWNNYYGDFGNFDAKALIDQVPYVAKIGLDYFCIDGGWAGGGLDSQFVSLLPYIGTWRPCPEKFPKGLEQVYQACREHGLKPGLWFDVEQANGQSESFIKHPELFAPQSNSNGCHLLRMDTQDGFDFAFDTISYFVREHQLEWIRYDCNIQPADTWENLDPTDRRGITEIRHITNLYRLFDRLLVAFPELVIENSASGGRRIELETLRRSHCQWIDDFTQSEAIVRSHIHGLCRWLPTNQINTSFAHRQQEPNRPIDWSKPLPDSAYLSHFGGSFSISDRLDRFNPAVLQRMAYFVHLWRKTSKCFADLSIPLGNQHDALSGPIGLLGCNQAGGECARIWFGNDPATTIHLNNWCTESIVKNTELLDMGNDQFISSYFCH